MFCLFFAFQKGSPFDQIFKLKGLGVLFTLGFQKPLFFEVFTGTTIVFLRDLNNKHSSTFLLMVLEA